MVRLKHKSSAKRLAKNNRVWFNLVTEPRPIKNQWLKHGDANVSENKSERRRRERKTKEVQAELYLESSVFKARTVDVSDEGVRLELNKPIRFHIRIRIGDKLVSRTAVMVWSDDAKAKAGLYYGFKYVK
ncbi:MAG: PilZ domain-containing protein [Candidatus Glassbacteria bacterium]|nr:PilZ domain-containing protein [Candidatus Glassbacteria bacterium]